MRKSTSFLILQPKLFDAIAIMVSNAELSCSPKGSPRPDDDNPRDRRHDTVCHFNTSIRRAGTESASTTCWTEALTGVAARYHGRRTVPPLYGDCSIASGSQTRPVWRTGIVAVKKKTASVGRKQRKEPEKRTGADRETDLDEAKKNQQW